MRAPASRAARYASGDWSFARASTAPPAAAPATGCAVTVSGESVPSAPRKATRHACGDPSSAERDRCAALHARAGARARRVLTTFINGRSTHSQLAAPAASASGDTRAASSSAVGVSAVIALTNRISGTCQR